MASNVEKRLDENLREYKHLSQAREYYGAVIRLAEIFACLPKLDKELNLIWMNILRNEQLPDEVIQAVEAGIEKNAQRIRRILSIGSEWNDDEILLVILTRIDIEMLLSFLKENYSREINIPLDDIDSKIEWLSKSKQNERAYKMAIAQMRKNWDLPIDSKWLKVAPKRPRN